MVQQWLGLNCVNDVSENCICVMRHKFPPLELVAPSLGQVIPRLRGETRRFSVRQVLCFANAANSANELCCRYGEGW